jgi:hypothetical protein
MTGDLSIIRRMRLGRWWHIAFAATILAPRLYGQQLNRGTLDGIVTDTSEAPLEGATVLVVASGVQARTGADGRFRIGDLSSGEHRVLVRRLGYAPLSALIAISAGDTARFSFTLAAVRRELEKVVIDETVSIPSLAEFEERRSRGVGQFMTEAEIRRLNFVALSDVLATFESVAVGPGIALNRRGFGVRSCPYRVFVDGNPVAVRHLDLDLPPPGQLGGIEVYENSANVPLQYATFGGDAGVPSAPGGAACGVILLWIKR